MDMDKNFPTIRPRKYFNTPRRHFILSGPFIWGMFLPMLLMDLMVEIYHHVCFPLYGLKLVPRKKYFFYDRLELPELSWFERINCEYCSYANGLAAYFVAIAGETEAYWCAIRHKSKISQNTQPHTKEFLDRGKFE